MNLSEYRFNSIQDPSDELLQKVMERVAEAARKSSDNAEKEKKRRLEEVAQRIKAWKSSKKVAYDA